jgi:hypothetical protein
MQAAASTRDADRSRRLETAAIDILCQTDDRTKAALVAQGLCTNPALTTADHRFDSNAVAQAAPPAGGPVLADRPVPPAPPAPEAQAYPVRSVQSAALASPPLRNRTYTDLYTPG